MDCTAKHSKYQPTEAEWICPKCGKPPQYEENGRHEEGWIIQDLETPGVTDDCPLVHDDTIYGCNTCEYGLTGKQWSARLAKAAGMVKCEHCKGSGLVKKS